MTDSETKTSYDEITYQSQPFPQSHPNRLATLGKLFGLSPSPVTQSRVLELGCASGGNLIPMAYNLPEGEFVGVDLSSRQIEMGRKVIADLGIKNIRLEHASIMDVDASWGAFDYIISHGVFSWVKHDVQEKILSISSKNLASNGVAYVSYNTYPGWHVRAMIRRMMLFHANRFKSSNDRIEQARALMDFLSRSVPTENNYYGMLLREELELIRHSRDWYLFHDHLEEVNDPIYFHEFSDLAEKHGLQYLGEAEFSTMLTSGLPQEVEDTLEKIGHDIIATEQYMDFVRNRHFRQTLLCHKTRRLKRDLGSDDVNGLLVASRATPTEEAVDLSPDVQTSFRNTGGVVVGTSFPPTKAALLVLADHWPRAIDFQSLFKEAQQRLLNAGIQGLAEDEKSRSILKQDLLHCYSVNLVEFHTWQADFVPGVSNRPKVMPLAAYQARQEQPLVNQRHELVVLDPLGKHLVRLLDGTKDRTLLVENLSELLAEGAFEIRRDNETLIEGREAEALLPNLLDAELHKLARSALLVE